MTGPMQVDHLELSEPVTIVGPDYMPIIPALYDYFGDEPIHCHIVRIWQRYQDSLTLYVLAYALEARAAYDAGDFIVDQLDRFRVDVAPVSLKLHPAGDTLGSETP